MLVQAFAAGPVFVITAKAVIQVFILDSVPHTPVLIERGWIPSGFRRNDGAGRRRLERFEPFDGVYPEQAEGLRPGSAERLNALNGSLHE